MKPSWGKTIGVFFLCWVLAFTSCVFASIIAGQSQGFSGYSRGGLSVIVVGIICAAAYRSSGKLAGAAIGAIVAGVIVGLLAVFFTTQMLAGQTASTSQSYYSRETSARSSAESSASKPRGEYLVKTSIDDPASLINSPLAKKTVESGRASGRWDDEGGSADVEFRRITFGRLKSATSAFNTWPKANGIQSWGTSTGLGDVPSYEDLREILYVALAEMHDDPERAQELLNNPNVSIYTCSANAEDPFDYVKVYDTFEIDDRQYMFCIGFIADTATHSQMQSGNIEIEIANHDIMSDSYDPVGRIQDLGWPVFSS